MLPTAITLIGLFEQRGGGFESDNHTFYAGTGGFAPERVPEPGVVMELAAVGGTFLLKCKKTKRKPV